MNVCLFKQQGWVHNLVLLREGRKKDNLYRSAAPRVSGEHEETHFDLVNSDTPQRMSQRDMLLSVAHVSSRLKEGL